MKADSIREELKKIIDEKNIRTLFQPIISMKTGEILGYETLSRGPEGSPLESPLALFAAAKKHKLLFPLEKVCREKALNKARELDNGYKIFINVDPHVIYDENFRGGMTKDFLKALSLSHKNIVIELTERSSYGCYNGFKKALTHYKDQGFKIAIDDTGAGYSGLLSIVSITYNYIKIDRSLIKDIDRDLVKQALLEAFVRFAKKIDSRVIAEGIETMDELDVLIDLGVDYAQGYLIARPEKAFVKDFAVVDYILKKNRVKNLKRDIAMIGEIALRDIAVTPDTHTGVIVDIFEMNENLHSVVILQDQKPVGLVMRDKLYSRLGTKFGYALYMDRPVQLIMNKNPLIVDFNTPIVDVSRKAMERELANIYDCIIVTRNDDYYGSVSIKTLLDKFAQLQVEEAKQLNPLTNLPGNLIIEEEISARLNDKEPVSVLYLDLDNFKVYNDRYGYKKGDEIIRFTAEILNEAVTKRGNTGDFIGHIGGDDFVIVTTPDKEVEISKYIIEKFDSNVGRFFDDRDRKAGYILGKNRQGAECISPLTSISIAIINNKDRDIESHLQISDIAAELKKYAKRKPGSVFVKDRRRS